MNIALITTGFDNETPEATKITILSLAKELKRLGHKPVIISDKREHLKKREIVEGIVVYRFYGNSKNKEPHKILNYFVAQRKTLKTLEKRGLVFDIIHNFSSSSILTIRGWLCKKASKRAKLIHSIKSSPENKDRFTKILNLNDKITVQTETLRKKLIQRGVNKDKIVEINSHIDTGKFKPLKNSLKKELGLEKKKVVLYYGPLAQRKGVGSLLLAIPRITKKIRDVKFVFVIKKTKVPKSYKKLLRNQKISKHLLIIKKHAEIPKFINMCDLVALPYPHLRATENNPSSILETMACKKILVTTNLSEIREMVKDKEEALLALPKNPKDLAEKIILGLTNKKLKGDIEKRAWKKSKKYDIKEIAERYLKTYNSLINPPSRPYQKI